MNPGQWVKKDGEKGKTQPLYIGYGQGGDITPSFINKNKVSG